MRRCVPFVRGLLLWLVVVCLPAAAEAQPVIQTASDLGPFTLGQLELPLVATGGTGVYSWALTGGALPPGISLRTDRPSWFPSNASAGLVGVATAAGTYNFTLTVTSGGVSSLPRAFSLRISGLMTGNGFWLPRGFVGQSYAPFTFTAVDAAGPVSWSTTSLLPAGMGLSAAGTLSGTPTQSGSFSLQVRLTDGVGTVFRAFQLEVFDIQITSPRILPPAVQNQPYSVTLTAEGGTAPYTFSSCSNCSVGVTNLPSGLQLDPVTGVLSGTPLTVGPWSFELTVTDANHVFSTKRLTIPITGDPPALPRISPSTGQCTFGFSCNWWVTVQSGGRAPFTWQASGLPHGMFLRQNVDEKLYWLNPVDADISGIPVEAGTFDVTVTVTDADGARTTNTFPLNVTALILPEGFPTPIYGQPYSASFRIIGGPSRPAGPGPAVSNYQSLYTATPLSGRLPFDLRFNDQTFTFAGTVQETGNPAFFRVRFTDLAGSTLDQSFNWFTPAPGNATLQITNFYDLGSVNSGGSLVRTLSACCAPSITWSVVGGAVPPGTFLSPDGQLTGTATTPGTYAFLAQAADATFPTNFARRYFTILVLDGTLPFFSISSPASSTLPFGNVGTEVLVNFATTGASGAVTWSLAEGSYLPPGLTFAAGVLSGTPTSTGQYTFTVTATDGAGRTTSRFNSLSIYPPGQAPPLFLSISSNLTANIGVLTLQLAASGGRPPYHYSPTPGAAAVPGMRVQDGPPLPTFFPTTTTGGFLGVLTAPGVYNTSIRVIDADGRVYDRAFRLTVPGVRVMTQSPIRRPTLGQFYSFQLTAYGGTGNYTWATTSTLPAGLSLDASTGVISGVPTAATGFSSSVVATDSAGVASAPTFLFIGINSFDITAPGEVSPGVVPPATVGTSYQQVFVASGCGATCTWTAFGLPSGLTFSASGVLSGTPTFATDTSITVQAAGSGGTVQRIFSLVIGTNPPQPLSNNSFGTSATIGTSVSSQLSASGGTGPYTWRIRAGDSLPPGIRLVASGADESSNLRPGGASLIGALMQAGTFTFTTEVVDAAGTVSPRAITYQVFALSNQYTSLPLSGTILRLDTPYSQPLLAIGGTGIYTWTALSALPPGLSLNATTGVVSGTPTNTGTFSTSIRIDDDAGNFTLSSLFFNIAGPTSVVITLSGPGGALVTRGSPVSFSITPSGGTAPYVIAAVSPMPDGFVLLSSDSSLSVPGTFFLAGVPSVAGDYSVTLRAQDANGNLGVRTFTFTARSVQLFLSVLPDGSVGVPYAAAPIAIDADGPVSWSIAPGSTLPPGLTLSAAGSIQGSPTVAGTYSFSLMASGSVPPPATFSFSLRISQLAIDDAPLPIGGINQSYTHTLTATGAVGTVTWTATGLPSGLTLSTAGTLSGTPTSTTSALIIVTATDGRIPVSKRFPLIVRAPVPGVLDYTGLTTLADVNVGQFMSFGFTASAGVPPYTVTVAPGSVLPAGLRLVSPADALSSSWFLAGFPTTAGLQTFDLIFTDSSGAQTRRTFTLNVSPLSLVAGIKPATPGVAYAHQFTVVGGTGPYTFTMSRVSSSVDMLPAGLAFSSSGLLTGTPQGTGSYSFIVRAQDALGRAFSRQYSLFLSTSTGMSINTNSPTDASVGTGRQLTLNASGGAASSFVWSVSGGSLPTGMRLVTLTGGATALGGAASASGLYTFTLRATDAANSANFAERVMTMRISPIQIVSPPIELFAVELPGGSVGVPYSYQLRVAGGTPGYTFALSSPAQPPAGLTLSASGLLSGTPQQSGNYPLELLITDAGGQSLRQTLPLLIAISGQTTPLLRITSTVPNASVGVPYVYRLDAQLRGGVGPFTWTLGAGAVLPPGMVLLPAASGIGSHLAGVPTAEGTYTFNMTASDSAGHVSGGALTLRVSTLVLSPDGLAPGIVGTPYSATLVPSGGTGPYTIQTATASDMPPGLSLSPGGVLSGTPTHAGNFQLAVLLIDTAGATLGRTYHITVDNTAGEAPALRVAPRPMQILHVIGAPPPAPLASFTTTSGAVPFGAAILGVPQLSLGAAGGTTSTSLPITLNTTGLSAGTYVGVLAAAAVDSVNRYDAVPVTLTVAVPPPCDYSINPPSSSAPFGGATGSVNVSAGSTCAWTATVSDPTWIRLTSAPAGTGNGAVAYKILQHTGLSARTGRITINGLVHEITQFGASCATSIQPAVINAPAAGGIANIQVSASQSFCSWTASGLGATPANGTGNNVVEVTVPVNTSAAGRQLQATIAGQTLTVNQSGIACTASLSPYEGTAGAAGGNGSVEVTVPAGCGYSTLTGPSWINVTSGASASASGTLVYSVAANSTTVPRSGTITIGGQSFVITQDPLACSVTIDTSSLGSPFGPAASGGTLRIATNGSNCRWNASADMPWVSLSAATGLGNADITLNVTSNAASTTGRNAVIDMNGQQVALTQQGTTCTYALQSDTGSVPGTGGSGAVGVLATSVCGWSAISNNTAWLTIASSGSQGNGDVRFDASANPTSTPRTGQLTIAGLTYPVTQAGAPCATTLPVGNTTVAASGIATASFGYTASACTPPIQSFASWITVTGGAAGTVEFSVLANPLAVNRVGTIQVGTRVFTVTQLGGACGFSLHSYGQLFGPAGGNANILGSQSALGCSPSYATDQPSFILFDTLTGPVNNIFTLPFSVTPFAALTPSYRIGRIDFGGVRFTVKQSSY